MGFSWGSLVKRSPNIQKLKARKDVDGLVKALAYRDPKGTADGTRVRAAAAAALGDLGDDRALEPLAEARVRLDKSKSDLEEIRRIGRTLSNQSAIAPIAGELEAIEQANRAIDAAVGKIRGSSGSGQAEVVEASAKPSQDQALSPTDRIQSLVLTLKTPVGARSTDDAIDQATKALVDIGEPAVEALIAAMDEDLAAFPMRYVIAPLGEIGDPRAVEALLEVAKDPNQAVRSAAVEALGNIRDPRVFEPVVNALGDSDKSVRFYAVRGLGQIGDARAVDALVAALNDPDESVRRWAADSLGVLKDRKAVEALIGVSVEDQAERVRAAALEALSEIDPEWAQDESAQQQAVSVELEGTALHELLHSGEIYSIALAGTEAKLDYRSGSFGERDGWFLVAPTGLAGRPERRIPIDPDEDPDRVVHQWLEEIPQRQVGLKPEGKIFSLIQSRPDVSYDNPIVIGNLAYLVDTGDKAWHLRIGVGQGAEQDVVVPALALLSSEAVDSWVLDTIAAVGLNLPR